MAGQIKGSQLSSTIILSGSFSGSFIGDGSGLTGTGGGSTPTLQQVTDQGASTTNLIVGNITSASLAEEASNNFDIISYNNSTFNITAIRTNGGQQSATITNVPSASYSDTASYVNPLEQNVIISGSLNVTSSFTASGLNYPSADGTDGQVIITDGAGNLSFGHGEKLHLQVRNDDSVDITAGTPIYSTGEIGGSERIKVKIAQASDASKMPAIGIVETTLTTTGGTQDGFAIINGIYNTNITPVSGTPALGDNVYVHADGGVTTIKPSGSNLIQNIGTVLKTNGSVIQGMKVSSIDRTNDVPNLLDNTIFFGSGSDQTQQIHISGALDQTVLNNITASGNISASGQIIGDIVDTSFENFLNFEAALTSYTYIAPFPLTINFTGSSTSSMEVVDFVTASANTDTFSVRQGLPLTLNRFDKLKITPSASGLFTFSGSRII